MELGNKAKDRVTGTFGTIVAITRYLYGEDECLISYKDKNGCFRNMLLPESRIRICE